MAKQQPRSDADRRARADADRRARQCARMGRILRLLRLISGPGSWGVARIAQELECSERTVFRDLQTLSMAGVPYHLDPETNSYRVQAGFTFPGLVVRSETDSVLDLSEIIARANEAIAATHRSLDSLNQLVQALQTIQKQNETC